ncbi:MAG: hypothetical protein RLZ44_209 [Pseudomonadota bacterium]|jgi:hypothetical protein
MLLSRPSTLLLTTLLCTAPAAWGEQVLTADEIEFLISDKTTACLKEKDQSTCTTYFAPDGIIKRRMHDDDARKNGRWFIDDTDRLCILWDGKIKPLCLIITRNEDGTYALTKKEKHVSSILELSDGNTEGL